MDKIFVDEAVNELHTIQDMLRWTVSRFNAANIFYGHGTDNPWDEAVQLVFPSLFLPLDIPEDIRSSRLTSSERHRIVERVIRRVNERIPVAYLTNKAWFCGMEYYVAVLPLLAPMLSLTQKLMQWTSPMMCWR